MWRALIGPANQRTGAAKARDSGRSPSVSLAWLSVAAVAVFACAREGWGCSVSSSGLGRDTDGDIEGAAARGRGRRCEQDGA